MIIIGGSSPAVGEWGPEGIVTHGGLGQYLKESGKEVINLGQPGQPDDVYFRILQNFIQYNQQIKVDKIIFFQSSWLDNFIEGEPIDGDYRKELVEGGFNHFADYCMSSLYYKLSQLGLRYNIPIYLVGTVTDTLWLDRFTEEYPMVTVACQSFVNLIINQNPRIDRPIRTLLHRGSEDIIKTLRNITPNIESIVNALDEFDVRRQVIYSHPEFFRESKWHINRHGHKILFDFLTEHYQI